MQFCQNLPNYRKVLSQDFLGHVLGHVRECKCGVEEAKPDMVKRLDVSVDPSSFARRCEWKVSSKHRQVFKEARASSTVIARLYVNVEIECLTELPMGSRLSSSCAWGKVI